MVALTAAAGRGSSEVTGTGSSQGWSRPSKNEAASSPRHVVGSTMTSGAASRPISRRAASLSTRCRTASGSVAGVGAGPPDSAPVLLTTTLWPSSRTTDDELVGGTANALSPSMRKVSWGVAEIASGLSRSPVGATAGREAGKPRSPITFALRACASG